MVQLGSKLEVVNIYFQLLVDPANVLVTLNLPIQNRTISKHILEIADRSSYLTVITCTFVNIPKGQNVWMPIAVSYYKIRKFWHVCWRNGYQFITNGEQPNNTVLSFFWYKSNRYLRLNFCQIKGSIEVKTPL